MSQLPTIAFDQIPSEGSIVRVQGHPMYAHNVRLEVSSDGTPVVRFDGECTDSDRNDSIRHTGYNGGAYGWRVDISGLMRF
jgi:hypothetical protein